MAAAAGVPGLSARMPPPLWLMWTSDPSATARTVVGDNLAAAFAARFSLECGSTEALFTRCAGVNARDLI